MHLKRLELHGFKSFGERTVLEFGPGISAIVGPNGSGKSNIADAIRWVLGEQNPRLLRGHRMEDVIFNGTASRKAMGMAEVLLTLDDTDGKLPTEYREITIGRRVDRSGGSEYFINQVPCRLRDIQELFYDTGIGREAYSVVAQGRVEEILSARPEERRSLLEEAAGIVRYKVRRQEALKRLAQVEERLTRLGDILAELEARLGPLQEAAAKARQHRLLREELRSLEIQRLQLQIQRAIELWRRRQGTVQRLRKELDRTDERLRREEATWLKLRETLQEHDQRLETTRGELERCIKEVDRLAHRQQILAERLHNHERRLEDLAGHESRLESQFNERQTMGSDDRQRLEELRRRHAGLSEQHEILTQKLTAVTREVQRAEAELTRAREAVMAAMNEVAKAENLHTRSVVELEALAERRSRLDERIEEIRRQINDVQAEVELLKEKASRERDRAEKAAEQVLQADTQRQRLDSARRQLQDQLRRLEAEISQQRSRVHALAALQRNYDGFLGGVRTVLRGRDRGEPDFSDVVGVVAQLVTTAPQYQAAIEAALGGGIQYLVTRTGDGAQRVIQRLRQIRGGRVTCLPLDGLRPAYRQARDAHLAQLPGVIGWADSLVSFPDEIRIVVDHLLSRVLVASDLTSARQAARSSGFRIRVVTLDGDIVHAGGAISGGSTAEQRGSLLNRQRELDAAREQVRQLEGRYAECSRQLAELDRQAAQITAVRERSATDVEIARRAAAALDRDAAAREQTVAGLRRQHDSLVAERGEIDNKERLLRGEVDLHRQAALRHRAAAEDIRKQVEDLDSRLPVLKQEEAHLQQALATAAASFRALTEQLQALEEWEERTQRELRLIQQQLDQCRTERQATLEAIAAIKEEQAELSREIEAAEQQQRHCNDQLQDLRRQRQGLVEAVEAAYRNVETLRRDAARQRERLHRAEIDETKAALAVEESRRRLRDQFGVEAPEPLPGNADQTGAREAEFERRIHDIREQLDALGAVNPGAEAEYEAVRHRFQFLSRQTADLTAARDDLHELLDQMERKMVDKFNATFTILRDSFKQVFRRLFGGGEADLVLLDVADDGEEAGIEILAQPPGKRLQPLSLLSGGERSLTALALLFALLEVKPAPFCVVDEVDAALDDHNLKRFTEYLQELSQRMQFIVITHQKQSMAIADTLYGVTLAENGSSRLVAVRLSDAVAEVATS